MVWKRKQRSLLLNSEQNKDFQILLGFLVVTCVFLAWGFFLFFYGEELVGFQKYFQPVQTISYCGWQLFCVSDDGHSNTPEETIACKEQMNLRLWLRENAPP